MSVLFLGHFGVKCEEALRGPSTATTGMVGDPMLELSFSVMSILVTAVREGVGGKEGVLGWQPSCLAPRQPSSGSCRIWRLLAVSQSGVARALRVPRAQGVEGSPGARLLAGSSLGFGWCTTYYTGFGEMTHVLARYTLGCLQYYGELGINIAI